MSVQITDCTIRDGGYLLNKNSNPDFVQGVMNGLVAAGIDFVETGFLQNECNGESIVYKNSIDARRYLPLDCRNTKFLGFCDNSRYSIDNLDNYDGKSFKWLRISFAKHEYASALQFCSAAQDKGYIVQFNPMDTISYSETELKDLISEVNRIKPGSFSIVDTFGAMYLDDLMYLFKVVDSFLDKDIKIGLHSHDNLGLSCALAEQMIMLSQERERNVIVDGSLLGMGRGAGNASTELLAEFLNKKYGYNYDIPSIISTIEQYILPLKSHLKWGYNLEMFICGSQHAHVDNISYLRKNTNYSITDMYKIIDKMPLAARTRYGTNYCKNDFTYLQNILEKYNMEVAKK